jgi:hypothetical protein
MSLLNPGIGQAVTLVTNTPNTRVRFTAQLIFTSVPETTPALGLLAFGLLCGASILKRSYKE